MPVTLSWFKNIDPYNPNHPLSYIISSTIPICEGSTKVCAIYAQVDLNNKPIINLSLSSEISITLQNQVNSENVLLRS